MVGSMKLEQRNCRTIWVRYSYFSGMSFLYFTKFITFMFFFFFILRPMGIKINLKLVSNIHRTQLKGHIAWFSVSMAIWYSWMILLLLLLNKLAKFSFKCDNQIEPVSSWFCGDNDFVSLNLIFYTHKKVRITMLKSCYL